MTDLRGTLKTLLNGMLPGNIETYVGSGISEVWDVLFGYPEEPWGDFFKTRGLAVVIGMGDETPVAGGATYSFPVSFISVDKGVTATGYDHRGTEIVWAAVQEAKRVINQSTADWVVSSGTEITRRMASSEILYGYTLRVQKTLYAELGSAARFVNQIYSITVGHTDSDNSTEAVLSSEVSSSLDLHDNDPYVKVVIPTGSDAVYQLIGNVDGEGSIILYDVDAYDTLFTSTDCQSTAGNQYAITSTSRNRIEYMTIRCYGTLKAAAGTESTKYSDFTLADGSTSYVYIRDIHRLFDHASNILGFQINFYYSAITRTDEA